MDYEEGKIEEEKVEWLKTITNILSEMLLLFKEVNPEAVKKVENRLKEVKKNV